MLRLLFSRLESCRLVADVQEFAVVFSPLEKHADSGGPGWIQAGTAEIRSEPGLGCVALIWFWALELEPGRRRRHQRTHRLKGAARGPR